MDLAGHCVAVVPCWNEAATIGRVVHAARRHLPAVIVANDGSTDATAREAIAAGAQLAHHARRRGKGAALRQGLHHAQTLGFDWALTLDGDGQHAAECIPAFLDRARTTGAAVVVGNRFASPRTMPWLRYQVNRWMSWQLSRQAGRFLPDSQCGFRLLRLDAWQRLELQSHHFEIESEMLLGLIRAGWSVEFVPIPCLPSPRPSRIRMVPDTCRWLRWWWRACRRPRALLATVVPSPTA